MYLAPCTGSLSNLIMKQLQPFALLRVAGDAHACGCESQRSPREQQESSRAM